MNSDGEIDFIIVGQGLAGSALAVQCCKREYKILVMDDPSQNRSSVVAAGLFNPITGKKMVKTWLADDIFPYLSKFYREVEELTGRRFIHFMPLYRPFATIAEQNEWMAKSADFAYRGFISHVSISAAFDGKINDPLGGVTFKQTGYLDTRSYLDAVRTYLASRGVFQTQVFDSDKLEIRADCVQYGGITAKKIIFCQGVQNASNRWFNKYPIQSQKGEFLIMQCDWKTDVIVNRGVFMLPGTGSHDWRVGATYNWTDEEPGTTELARQELTRKLDDHICIPYTVTAQHWGLRPTTPDRKPVIGSHPRHHCLIIFNGFGTKGVSLAPYFSEVLIRWVENKGTISKEADVSRFN